MTNDTSLCYVVGAMPLDPGFILTPVPGDLVIAADKGYETLSRLGVHPGLVVGDFDSLGSVPDHPQVLRLPRIKDETDTGFALRQGLKRGYRRFVLLGCLGGLVSAKSKVWGAVILSVSVIALLMGSIIGDSSTTAAWISPLFYFLGVFAVIASGLMLKKTKLFAGRPTPFVMELPAYHFPAIRSWALHVWERCWAFIKKAGTVIFASTVVVWFLSNFGSYNGSFGFLPAMDGIPEEFMDYSVLAMLGNLVAWIFAPLGFSTWQATALTVSGLVAKENVVATAGSLLSVADAAETDPSLWTAFAGMFPTMGACVAFGAFNLLCAPCFAAMGTIRNQMDSGKWTAIAIGYECAFAWVIGLFINQFYNLLVLGQFGFWTVVAIVLLVAMLFQIFRPMPKHAWTDEDETNTASAAVSA